MTNSGADDVVVAAPLWQHINGAVRLNLAQWGIVAERISLIQLQRWRRALRVGHVRTHRFFDRTNG
jgi:hypothetical protein